MTNRPELSRTSRQRRREAMLNAISKLIGCAALVVTVAVVFYVAITQLDKEGPRIDPSYLEESRREQVSHRWSGSATQPKDSLLNLPRPVLSPRKPSLSATETNPRKTTPRTEFATAESQTGSLLPDEKRPKIEQAVKKFFNARTVAEKAASSRDSGRVQGLMEVYYKTNPIQHGEWLGLGWVMPMDEPGHRLAYAQTLFKGADPICVIVEEDANMEFRVDWESSVRYSEINWNDFLATRPEQPKLFRVIASKPKESPPPQMDPRQEMVELKHPAEQGIVYAYFNREDPQFRSLLEQLKLGNWSNVPLTLRLCYPGPTSSSRAVRITSIEGKGWLILQNRRS